MQTICTMRMVRNSNNVTLLNAIDYRMDVQLLILNDNAFKAIYAVPLQGSRMGS